MVRHGTLRSDFLPPARKIVDRKANRITRGRWRSTRTLASNDNAGITRSRARQSPGVFAGRIKVVVPNRRTSQRGRAVATRNRNVDREEPVYQFKKYLQAMKDSGNLTETVTRNAVVNEHSPGSDKQESKQTRVIARSIQTGTLYSDQSPNQSKDEINMEVGNDSDEDQGSASERKIKLVKTIVATSPKTRTSQGKFSKTSSRNNRRTVKGHRTTAGNDNLTPSARLFWKSFS